MKLKINKSSYQSGACELTVSPDLKEVRATSYSWTFVATDKAGNVFVNTERYSVTTSTHQRAVTSKLQGLGIDYTTISGHSYSLSNVKECLRYSIKAYIKEAKALKKAAKKKGTRKAKNALRLGGVRKLYFKAKDLRRILLEYVDKKPIPHKAPLADLVMGPCIPDEDDAFGRDLPWEEFQRTREFEFQAAWARWYTKPNGALDVNGFRVFLGEGRYHGAPQSIDKIKALFGVKGNESLDWILRYRFVRDTENGIPEVDSLEYKAFQAFAKRMRNHPRNVLLMDKLHQFQINRLNRRDYTPREAVKLPIPERIQRLRGVEGVRLIETDQALRAEGRSQGHCIGGKQYQNMVQNQGYCALNFKGYTFLLDPWLNISQTNGRHNSYTPMELRKELIGLIEFGVLGVSEVKRVGGAK